MKKKIIRLINAMTKLCTPEKNNRLCIFLRKYFNPHVIEDRLKSSWALLVSGTILGILVAFTLYQARQNHAKLQLLNELRHDSVAASVEIEARKREHEKQAADHARQLQCEQKELQQLGLIGNRVEVSHTDILGTVQETKVVLREISGKLDKLIDIANSNKK